jgi:uncharacterized protein (DUF1330 family)
MPFEMLVGLNVTDQKIYAQYRAEIASLLDSAGAGFRHDFEIARTLKTDASHEINRVFVLRFPDRAARDRFFADPRYLEIRSRLFAKSVDAGGALAEYDV